MVEASKMGSGCSHSTSERATAIEARGPATIMDGDCHSGVKSRSRGLYKHVLEACLSSKLVEMDRSSLPIEVEEGLGRRSAVAEAIPWAEQETEIVMFAISCLLLANYESLQL
jgi:hypothetical protein